MTTPPNATLLDLLGDTRAQVVELLRGAPSTAGEVAAHLDMSAVAVRRHLQVLERDGLVDAQTVRRNGPGRPSSRYTLTDRARQLFPDRSAELANELLDYLEEVHGRSALNGFLRWRQARQGARYAEQMQSSDSPAARADVLARLLSADGFAAQVRPVDAPEGATVLELRQAHCAIADVADAHPEVCAYEAALFKQVLGANVSRKSTIAGGADACVCHITIADKPSRPDPQMRSTHGHQS